MPVISRGAVAVVIPIPMAMQAVAEGQLSWLKEVTVTPLGPVPYAQGPAMGPDTAMPAGLALLEPMATQAVADGQLTWVNVEMVGVVVGRSPPSRCRLLSR